MESGDFPPLVPPEDPGDPADPSMSNRRDGTFTGRSFPEWGDSNGDFGKLRILRLEGVSNPLPKRPFEIRKSVESFLGVKVKEARPENKGTSYVIKLRNEKQFKKLKEMTKLLDGTPIKIAEHPTLNQCRCVVYSPESTEYETDELMKELAEQGVKEVRRITRKEGSKIIPTPTIILTIDGTMVPQSINFGWINVRTRPYYPTPMLCYGCYDYGHPRKRCDSKLPVCGVCSGKHANTPENPCQLEPFCKHCRNNSHPLMSKKCPVYIKEVDIQHLMVDQGISYPAARRVYESNHRLNTTASVVAASNDARFEQLNKKFDLLLLETGKKDQQLEFLKNEGARRDKQINELFAVINARDKIIAQKDARIAALEATLTAANIKIPMHKPSNENTTEEINETTHAIIFPVNTTVTGKTKQTDSSCSNSQSTLSHHKSRPRSRSPQQQSQKQGKDGRRRNDYSNQERLAEPNVCNEQESGKIDSQSVGGKHNIIKKDSGETSPKRLRNKNANSKKKSNTISDREDIQLSHVRTTNDVFLGEL